MLKEPPRNAIAIPSPMRMSGTARTRVAEVNAYQEPNAPLNSAPSATPGSYPARYRPALSRVSPISTAATAHHSLVTSLVPEASSGQSHPVWLWGEPPTAPRDKRPPCGVTAAILHPGRWSTPVRLLRPRRRRGFGSGLQPQHRCPDPGLDFRLPGLPDCATALARQSASADSPRSRMPHAPPPRPR